MTLEAWVCCSITSEIHTPYGEGFSLQGNDRLFCKNQVRRVSNSIKFPGTYSTKKRGRDEPEKRTTLWNYLQRTLCRALFSLLLYRSACPTSFGKCKYPNGVWLDNCFFKHSR